jgi:hypothetical protein
MSIGPALRIRVSPNAGWLNRIVAPQTDSARSARLTARLTARLAPQKTLDFIDSARMHG